MENVIKNPSLSELEEMEKKQRTTATPVKEKKISKNEKRVEVQKYKSSNNPFAPKGHKVKLRSGGITINSELLEEDGSVLFRPITLKETTLINKWINIISKENQNSFNMDKSISSIINMMVEILQSCVLNDIEVGELPYHELLYLFYSLVEITFKEIDSSWNCEGCKTEYKIKVNPIKDVNLGFLKLDIEHPKEIDLEGFEEKFKIHLSAILIKHLTNILSKESSGIVNTENIKDFIMGVYDESGNEINGKAVSQMCEMLQTVDIKKIGNYYSDLGMFEVNYELKPDKCVCKNKKCSKYNEKQSGHIFDFQDVIFSMIEMSSK